VTVNEKQASKRNNKFVNHHQRLSINKSVTLGFGKSKLKQTG